MKINTICRPFECVEQDAGLCAASDELQIAEILHLCLRGAATLSAVSPLELELKLIESTEKQGFWFQTFDAVISNDSDIVGYSSTQMPSVWSKI